MILTLSELSDEPLHAQISRQIRAKILSEDLAGGHALPSIRGMAKEQRVSVITVQRSYEDLEREGLLQARRGKGFWVAPIPEGRKQKMEMIMEGAMLERATVLHETGYVRCNMVHNRHAIGNIMRGAM